MITKTGHFGLAENSQTDVDRAVEWIRQHHPQGCTLLQFCKGSESMSASRKSDALKEAVEQARLIKIGAMYHVPECGNMVQNSSITGFC